MKLRLGLRYTLLNRFAIIPEHRFSLKGIKKNDTTRVNGKFHRLKHLSGKIFCFSLKKSFETHAGKTGCNRTHCFHVGRIENWPSQSNGKKLSCSVFFSCGLVCGCVVLTVTVPTRFGVILNCHCPLQLRSSHSSQFEGQFPSPRGVPLIAWVTTVKTLMTDLPEET